MNAENIKKLLEGMGSKKVHTGSTGWVYGTCPLAPWTHAGGSDSRPSFAIAIEDDGGSSYKCHGCQSAGTLKALVWNYTTKAKSDAKKKADLLGFVQKYDEPSVDRMLARLEAAPTWGTKKAKVGGITINNASYIMQKAAEVDDTIPESVFDTFSADLPEDVRQYLLGERGFTEETIKKFDVRWHPKAHRIGVPVRDSEGRLVCITGRIFPNMKGVAKWLHSTGFRKELYLHGEHLIENSEVAYICEGPFDVMALWQAGYRTPLAIFGSTLNLVQAEKIVRTFKRAVIVTDGDKAGKAAADMIIDLIGQRLPCKVAQMPEGKDPDDLSKEQLAEILGEPENSLTI